jgi:hypothetical protein
MIAGDLIVDPGAWGRPGQPIRYTEGKSIGIKR